MSLSQSICFFALIFIQEWQLIGCLEEKPLEFEDIVDKRTYDKMRPPKPSGKATTVSFHVTVMSLDTIDEGSMTYAADVFFAQEWKDHRLILPDNMTREYRLLPVEWLHLIWRPDSFFKNAKKVTFQTMTIPNHYVWLYKDKTILYMVKLTLLLSCAMHFENYPHDEQICRLSMESLSHTTDDLIFIWLPEDKVPLAVDEGIQLPQLELVSNTTEDCTTVYTTGNFTCLEVMFRFRRRLGYYLFHTYIPTCLIVMMSWISFWIKPEAVPARVTLGVTSLLTLSTQHANSQKSLPPVSYIKAIDIFMSSCTVFVFLSLIEYAFVNVMMGDISEVERKDKTSQLRSIINTNNQDAAMHQHNSRGVNVQYSMAGEGGGGGHNANHHYHHHHQQHLQHHQQQHYHDHMTTLKFGDVETIPLSSSVLATNPESVALASVPTTAASAAVASSSSSSTQMDPCPKHRQVSSAEQDAFLKEDNNKGSGGGVRGGGGILSRVQKYRSKGGGGGRGNSNNKKKDPKEIMKRRREQAICIDRVSRVIFPSTFILLNIIYWIVFSDILEAIQSKPEL